MLNKEILEEKIKARKTLIESDVKYIFNYTKLILENKKPENCSILKIALEVENQKKEIQILKEILREI